MVYLTRKGYNLSMLRSGLATLSGLTLTSSAASFIAALQAEATDKPADTFWLWIAAIAFLVVGLLLAGVWMLLRDDGKGAVAARADRQSTAQAAGRDLNITTIASSQPVRRILFPVPTAPPDELVPTRSVLVERYGIRWLCRERYKISKVLKIEAQCPEHKLRLQTRSNGGTINLYPPDPYDWISSVSSQKHFYCSGGDSGHRLYFRGSEGQVKMLRILEVSQEVSPLLEQLMDNEDAT